MKTYTSPKINYIIPVLEDNKILPKTIESINAQDHRNFDYRIFICVNGKSWNISRLFNFKKKYQDTTVIFTSTGRSQARNGALLTRDCDFYAFIDSDIILSKNWLTTTYNMLNKTFSVSFTNINPKGSSGFLNYIRDRKNKNVHKNPFYFNSSAFLIRSQTFKEIRFNQALKRAEDTDFLFSLIKKGFHINYKTAFYGDVYFIGGLFNYLILRELTSKYYQTKVLYTHKVELSLIKNIKVLRNIPICYKIISNYFKRKNIPTKRQIRQLSLKKIDKEINILIYPNYLIK